MFVSFELVGRSIHVRTTNAAGEVISQTIEGGTCRGILSWISGGSAGWRSSPCSSRLAAALPSPHDGQDDDRPCKDDHVPRLTLVRGAELPNHSNSARTVVHRATRSRRRRRFGSVIASRLT